MAREQAQDGGIIEKTIFILKPVYVPVPMPQGKQRKVSAPVNLKYKCRNKQQRDKARELKNKYRAPLLNHHMKTLPFTGGHAYKQNWRDKRSSLSQNSDGGIRDLNVNTGSMKNILVSGDPNNPDYVLVNRESSLESAKRGL